MTPSKSPENAYLYLTSEDETRQRVGFLPVGSVECHGGALPLGTDLLTTRAFAQTFARQVDGIIFPEIAYGYCPNTAQFPGTISPRIGVLLPFLMEACRQAQQACERLILLNIHRGNDAPIALAIDELLQADGIALYYVNPYVFLGEAVDASLFPGRDNSYKEAALLLAALRVLGDPHADAYVADADETASRQPEMSLLLQHGRLGLAYPTPAAHIAARADVNVQAGLDYFTRAAEQVAVLVDAWRTLNP